MRKIGLKQNIIIINNNLDVSMLSKGIYFIQSFDRKNRVEAMFVKE